jgi:hypothetical protein
VAGVVGLVVGIDGDEIDTDLVRYLRDQAWLQELLPDLSDLAFAGHLVSIISAGG